MSSKKLISDEYRKLNEQLHSNVMRYGLIGKRLFDIMNFLQAEAPKSVLDYGCGKGRLGNFIRGYYKDWQSYDPGIDKYSEIPNKKFEVVICFDVMEHVEEEYIENVLEHIHSCTDRLVFFYISTEPSSRILPDGRNTHITLKSEIEWLCILDKYFTLRTFKEQQPAGFYAVCAPRNEIKKS